MGAKPASNGPGLIRARELGIAAVIGGGLLAILIVVLLVSRGGNDRPATSATPFAALAPDEVAIESLARQSIEVLPRGEWPSLYESFTLEYQQRCPREQFVAAGEAGALEQGENLELLRFVRLEEVAIESDSATAVIVGEITGQNEYRVRGAFQRVAGSWKLAPSSGTEGCSAFDRVVPS
jgi:hypothetical protein